MDGAWGDKPVAIALIAFAHTSFRGWTTPLRPVSLTNTLNVPIRGSATAKPQSASATLVTKGRPVGAIHAQMTAPDMALVN